MKSDKCFFAFHVLAPVFTGGLIYILWRVPSLILFSWLDTLGLYEILVEIRTIALPIKRAIPEWALYSLPDALWAYSLTSFMVYFWLDSKSKIKYLWLASGPLIGGGIEVGQYFGIIPGTFDVVDLILVLLASLLAFCLIINTKKGGLNEKY